MIAGSSTLDSAGETILIVEDEVLIRFDVADYLRTCGYRVIEAANATEAIAVLQSGRRIDLVFSDVQLPGSMDGFALARWVRAHQPEIKVILTSGVSRSAEVAGELCEEGPLEKKPYDPQHLLERIRSTLARVRRAKQDEPERLRSRR
jgi:DNA-binding response OmpR family regulator